jgi:hypothetical protein
VKKNRKKRFAENIGNVSLRSQTGNDCQQQLAVITDKGQ